MAIAFIVIYIYIKENVRDLIINGQPGIIMSHIYMGVCLINEVTGRLLCTRIMKCYYLHSFDFL